ncbi:hypothetical protein HMPREF9370_1814 [Neisseria wadsworthii 9715]|uniref:Flotillin C-terminal domain-containing protein n=1 Tax=Neisseria wadsworthii 9715 TaxID=1030841 RepID=G4CRV4_9NEIS|nr:hypothetical protein HMPREF9370_1814 [Neisseria wadsworthii 9715]
MTKLTKLTETIEVRRKKRNDIEQDTDLAIKTKNLEAERTRLQILREEEYAKLEQEREDDIKILQVNGLGGFGSTSALEGIEGATPQGNLADEMVNSALRYRSQAPLVDNLLKELGLNDGDINGLTQGLDKTISPKTE